MANQPQIPQAGSEQPGSSIAQPIASSDGTKLNPLAVNIAKAIRLQEGGGKVDYGAVGDLNKGVSKGAYQFNKNNFQEWATRYKLDPTDFSPVNQDKVAYSRIDDLLKQGRSPSEVAAIWNGAHVENGKYMPNNPAYVDGVKKQYAGVVGAGSQPQEQATTEQPAPTDKPKDPGLTGNGLIDSAADFLFPIAGDLKNDITGKSTKTGLQQLGDAGLSALPFIPGLGEAGEAARGTEAAAGILPKLLGSKLAKGAAVGYGAGALGNLSSGQSLGQSITPNLGTLGGAATGGLANTLLPKILAPFTKNFTKGGALSAVENNLQDATKRWQGLRTSMAGMPNGGKDALSLIARTPDALPVVENGTYNGLQGAQKIYKQELALGQLRASALDKMGGIPPSLSGERAASLEASGLEHNLPQSLQQRAQTLIDEQYKDTPFEKSKGQELAAQIASMKDNYGGDHINWSQLEKIKEAFPYNSPIARASRSMLEEGAKESNAPDLAELNKAIQTHIHARKILGVKGLHGKVVPGGRLGNMLRGHTAGVIGSMAGDVLGGGFPGLIGGALGGEAISKLLSRWMGETSLSNPVRDALIERLQVEDPQIVQKYANYVGQQGQVAPQRQKPATKSGILPRLMVTAAARAGGSLANQ